MTLDCLKYFIFIPFVHPNTSVKYLLFCHLVDEKSQRSERISNLTKMTVLGNAKPGTGNQSLCSQLLHRVIFAILSTRLPH